MTRFDTIRKTARAGFPEPNLRDYAAACRDFSWAQARAELAGLPGGGLNIAYEALDRHVRAGAGERVALRWLPREGAARDLTYAMLTAETARFAGLLRRLGLGPGARVFSLLGREPALYVTALGSLRAGAVYSPLFSAFGPEPVRTRIEIGEGELLVTSAALYAKKVAPWRAAVPSLRHVLLTDCDGDPPPGCLAWEAAIAGMPGEFAVHPTRPEDPALLHFTSGTTGKPKGALHVHEAVVAHAATGRLALDLRPDDVSWCTADPGWVTGTSYGIISPLANGATLLVDQAEFDAERWYRILQDQRVDVWYTAPTAIRMLMKVGADMARRFDLSALRFMASVGEPLNPEAVVWSNEVFGQPFHDNWWQTETGGIMVANYRSAPVKPGSMGLPLPGIEAGIVSTEGSHAIEVAAPMTVGELALRPGWPSMFRGYLKNEERYRKCFVDGWYLTGDLAMRDAEGYFWFVGRADDMIKSSGHLIGPFEVESSLLEHPAVAEAAVIGVPDERAGEVVKAFVALRSGQQWDEALRRDILAHARRALGPAVAPREVVFVETLPRPRSGTIMRRVL